MQQKPDYKKTALALIPTVVLLVLTKDYAVESGFIPDRRYSHWIFVISIGVGYGFHRLIQIGCFSWFARRDCPPDE